MALKINNTLIDLVRFRSALGVVPSDLSRLYFRQGLAGPRVLVWEGGFFLDHTITGDTSNFSLLEFLYAEGWDGATKVIGTITIAAGVEIYSAIPSQPSFLVSGIAPSLLEFALVNNGSIIGAGGPGGGVGYTTPDVGSDGGTALQVTAPILFSNNGEVLGGGGGGGGGVEYGDKDDVASGGGGGGGRVPGVGGEAWGVTGYNWSGSPGTRTAGGARGGSSGLGGNGGAPGLPGQAGYSIDGNYTVPIPGGLAGYAIHGESYITWLGGDTPAQIRGRRI